MHNIGATAHRQHRSHKATMRAALTALLVASSLQDAGGEAWGPAPTPFPELGFAGGALLTGAVLGCSAAAGSFAFVRQGDACLIERLGRYKRTLTAGLHPKLPFVESVAAYSSIKERVLDVPAQRCITKDNAPLSADAVVFYRITDLTKAKYAIDDYRLGVSNLVLTQLRSEIGQLTLDETFTAREQLNAILLREANAVSENWGVQVLRVEVRDILPSPEIISAMELQMAAERKKRAAVLESEGKREAAVNAATGRRDAVVLAAEGERARLTAEATGMAEALASVGDALAGAKGDKAAALLIARARIAADLALATSANAKVIVSNGSGGELGGAAGAAALGATLGLGGAGD